MCLRGRNSFSEIEALLELSSKLDEIAPVVGTSSRFSHQMPNQARFFQGQIVSYHDLSED
ncbi:hypothetical protein HAX54_032568, partial [Datura stramonium]|nr:hypothetical protein [Datura stramonium]